MAIILIVLWSQENSLLLSIQYNSLQIFIYWTFTGTCSQLYDVTHDSEIMADQTISLSFYPKPRCQHLEKIWIPLFLYALSLQDVGYHGSTQPIIICLCSVIHLHDFVWSLTHCFPMHRLPSIYPVSVRFAMFFFSSRCTLEILTKSFLF